MILLVAWNGVDANVTWLCSNAVRVILEQRTFVAGGGGWLTAPREAI